MNPPIPGLDLTKLEDKMPLPQIQELVSAFPDHVWIDTHGCPVREMVDYVGHLEQDFGCAFVDSTPVKVPASHVVKGRFFRGTDPADQVPMPRFMDYQISFNGADTTAEVMK